MPETKLTPRMRATLEQLARQPLRKTVDNTPAAWPHPATLTALIRHNLAEHAVGWNLNQTAVQESLQITDTGRQAIEPPVIFRPYRPTFMGRGALRYKQLDNGRWAVDDETGSSDYTTDPRQSIEHEIREKTTEDGRTIRFRVAVHVVDPDTLDSKWRQHAEGRHHKATRDDRIRSLIRRSRAA